MIHLPKWEWEKNEWVEWGESWGRRSKEEREGEKQRERCGKNSSIPSVPSKKDKEKQFSWFMDIFKKLDINIPLSEALQQMSSFTKFMKYFLNEKNKYIKEEVVEVKGNCSAVIQKILP